MSSKQFNGRWIRRAKTTYAPSCVVVVVPELQRLDRNVQLNLTTYNLRRLHVSYIYRRGHIWRDACYLSFSQPDMFWSWLESFADTHRKTYLFTDSVIDCFSLSDFWGRITKTGCINKIDPLLRGSTMGNLATTSKAEAPGGSVTSDPQQHPDTRYHFTCLAPCSQGFIVKYSHAGKSYQWTDFTNYLQTGERDIARAVGFSPLVNDTIEDECLVQEYRPADRCHLWCKCFQWLVNWWLENDSGPWQATTAGLAYSFLKKRIKDQQMLHHFHERATALEADALHGGRRSVWYLGNIGDCFDWENYSHIAPARSTYGTVCKRMIHHDIRSMYPYLLANCEFPMKLVEHHFDLTVESLQDALSTYGVIATVELQTHLSEYPMRAKEGCLYPVGSFVTTLAGPELASALGSGEVRRVYRANYYLLGKPFESACFTLLKLRKHYQEQDQFAWEMFAKMLANSMTGKLAQRQYKWVAEPDAVCLQEWGFWTEEDAETQLINHYKSWAGMTWKRVHKEAYSRPMAAAYAYLTSYGRLLMKWVRSMCPHGSVIAQDTDGIWTFGNALSSLYQHGVWSPYDAGSLRIDKSTAVGRFFSPQTYWYGDGWVLSGQAAPLIHPQTDYIETVKRHSEAQFAVRQPAAIVYERREQHYLRESVACSEITSDGWVLPPKRFTMPTD